MSQTVLSYSNDWLMIAAAETQTSCITYLFSVILALHSKQEMESCENLLCNLAQNIKRS